MECTPFAWTNASIAKGTRSVKRRRKNTREGRTGKNGKIIVQYSFYEDLVKNNLYENYKEKRNVIIYQGDLDETALIQETYKFIENRPEIELVELKGMKHHMETDELEIVAKQMIKKISL